MIGCGLCVGCRGRGVGCRRRGVSCRMIAEAFGIGGTLAVSSGMSSSSSEMSITSGISSWGWPAGRSRKIFLELSLEVGLYRLFQYCRNRSRRTCWHEELFLSVEFVLAEEVVVVCVLHDQC